VLKKTPPPAEGGGGGVKLRGTTSSFPALRSGGLGECSHTPARYRAHPSGPTAGSGRPLRKVFRPASLPPYTDRRLSARGARGYFIPSQRFTMGIL